jgi:hypothetical protein
VRCLSTIRVICGPTLALIHPRGSSIVTDVKRFGICELQGPGGPSETIDRSKLAGSTVAENGWLLVCKAEIKAIRF